MAEPWTPTQNHDSQFYWQGCARRELVIARCDDCGYWLHPPKGVCAKCWSERIGHEAVSGQATVYSFVTLPAARQGAGAEDRVTVWAELPQQDRLIVVADLAPGEAARGLAIGDAVELAWGDHRGASVPNFRKVAG